MGPHTLHAPDNLEKAIIKFMSAARDTLDIAVQELESVPIAKAIVAARQRGVTVRIVLEGDYLVAPKPSGTPFIASGKHEPNRELFNALLRAGVNARVDYNPNIFHQKFIVRDRKLRGAGRRSILTGSTNFTPTGTHKNLNHLVIVSNGHVVREYSNEFEEIWNGTFGAKRLRHDPRPRRSRVSGVRVKVLFAPDHSPEMEIMKQMMKARKSIEFAIFTFAQSSGIDDAMIAMQRSGITVRGTLDYGQGNRGWAATRPLADAGAKLFLSKRGTALGKLHHKLMVIDNKVIVAGSFNYTDPANRLNDENILVIGDADETDPESDKLQRELASYAIREIKRIMDDHSDPVVPLRE